MTVRVVKLVEPCRRCGGGLAELSGPLLRTPRCHYCGALAKVPWPDRLEAWTGTLGSLLGRGTAFHRAGSMVRQPPRELPDQLRAAISDLFDLYSRGTRDVLQTVSSDWAGDERDLLAATSLLGRALLIKILAGAMPTADNPPKLVALVMQRLGREPSTRTDAGLELGKLLALAPDIDWRMVLRPFRELPSFRRRTAELVTHASRIVNLVIKFDGVVSKEELEHQQLLQSQLKDHIAGFPRLAPPTHQQRLDRAIFDQLREDGAWLRRQLGALAPPRAVEPGESPLDAALFDLDALVGIELVKQDVRGLVDVLRLRVERQRLGLPDADLRFHVAFLGNEGTGQGTVAAILGRISAALGELARGQLTETSGDALALGEADVDERFDAALGGVLLVHHANRLKSAADRTPRVQRVWQRLLERGERDRARLMLVLSGERAEMERLLAEFALSERFRRLQFEDYSVIELGRVLESMARQYRYRLSYRARLEILNGLSYWVERDGALGGNARTLRIIFEQAVERQAQRLAHSPSVSGAGITLMDAEDFVLQGVPDEIRTRTPRAIRTECPRCGRAGRFLPGLLGERIQCRACRHEMLADWGIASDT